MATAGLADLTRQTTGNCSSEAALVFGTAGKGGGMTQDPTSHTSQTKPGPEGPGSHHTYS